MDIKLLHHTPLWVASTAIRKCWASEGKSDTTFVEGYTAQTGTIRLGDTGDADKALIHRIGNKYKHASTLEHLNYSFDIDGISRACLQELARHRHASLSVKSTRYTLKELKNTIGHWDIQTASRFCVIKDDWTDAMKLNIMTSLDRLRDELQDGVANDIAKYCLPESYKTSLVWTVNARSLQNFLALRTAPSALWEIRDLANELFNSLPEEHKYLFEESIYNAEQ